MRRLTKHLTEPAFLALLSALFVLSISQRAAGQPDRGFDIATSRQIHIGSAEIQVDFASGEMDLPIDTVLAHVQSAAFAVTTYFGRFPLDRARIVIIPVPGKAGIMQGTTWGDMSGFQGFTRIHIGQHTTTADLADDWMMTHELVHMGFPSLPRDQHWMEEGLATYIEPIARVETGELTAKQIWGDMMHDMHKGEPAADDRGWTTRTPGAGPTGAEPCSASSPMLRSTAKPETAKASATRFAPSWPVAAPSIMIGACRRHWRSATALLEPTCSPICTQSGKTLPCP